MTAEMFDVIVSWPTFGMVLLVFGFLPGTVLRLAVRLYPKGDPRREELVNDLYVMKPYRRPLWVVQQLETALHEGLAERWSKRHRPDDKYRTVRSIGFGLLWFSSTGAVVTAALYLLGVLSWWLALIGVVVVSVALAGGIWHYTLYREGTLAIAQQPEINALAKRLDWIRAEMKAVNESAVDRKSAAAAAVRIHELDAQLAEAGQRVISMRRGWFSRLIIR